jgi:hypothetical protein
MTPEQAQELQANSTGALIAIVLVAAFIFMGGENDPLHHTERAAWVWENFDISRVDPCNAP